jgi:hypothetical protein
MHVGHTASPALTQGIAVAAVDRKAPPADDLPPVPEVRPRATSRVILLLTYLAVLVMLAMRVPQTYEQLRLHIPPGLSAGMHDKDMEALALKTGVFLALAVSAFAIAIFFALAVLLEKRIFTARVSLGAKVSIGLYVLVVALCVLPPQAASVLFGAGNLRVNPLMYVYVASVGLLSPWLFHRAWRDLSRGSTAIVFGTSAGLAALTVMG